MPSVKHNLIMAKAMGLIFSLFDIASSLLAYRSTWNVFFKDLPVSSFVFHSSLLTVKIVDLVVTCDGFLYVTEIVCIFHSGYLDYRQLGA